MRNRKKRGLSPNIATALLIAITIIIALIVFFWIKSMRGEVITKFEGENVETACGDLKFTADYTGGTLSIVNNGDVAIFKMKLKVFEDGNSKIFSVNDFQGLNAGESFSGYVGDNVGSSNKILLIPILLGNSNDGEKTFLCNEEYGVELLI